MIDGDKNDDDNDDDNDHDGDHGDAVQSRKHQSAVW